MAPTLMGTKRGMTRVFTEEGVSTPVTVIELGPCVVTQVRTPDRDGYSAVQIGFGEAKVRRTPIPTISHDAKAGTTPKQFHVEFRVSADEVESYQPGQVLGLADLGEPAFVDVMGTSKGKGFQGGMKRHNFKGQIATHGVERKHRSPGSIGGHSSNAGKSGGLKKGKKMAGHMGDERVTVRSLDVVQVDPARNLILVKGPVPGCNGALVHVRPSVRLYKRKASKESTAWKGGTEGGADA